MQMMNHKPIALTNSDVMALCFDRYFIPCFWFFGSVDGVIFAHRLS